MKKSLSLIACVFALISCEKKESVVSNRPLLYEKFNGKYELVSSFSDKAVDLNNDGIESKNLLDENEMVLESSIEIRIPAENDLVMKDNEFVFTEFWPTENEHRLRVNDVVTEYNSFLSDINGYDIYGNIVIGMFDDELKACTFNKTINDDGKNTLIEIKSIELMENETIKLTVARKLFTKQGWVISEIESVYKRYTIVT